MTSGCWIWSFVFVKKLFLQPLAKTLHLLVYEVFADKPQSAQLQSLHPAAERMPLFGLKISELALCIIEQRQKERRNPYYPETQQSFEQPLFAKAESCLLFSL